MNFNTNRFNIYCKKIKINFKNKIRRAKYILDFKCKQQVCIMIIIIIIIVIKQLKLIKITHVKSVN